MTHPRVDMYGIREEDAPEFNDRDFANTRIETAARGTDDYNTTADSEPLSTSQHKTRGTDTIILKTHDGDGYVLPILEWKTTKTHIEDIYRLRNRETLAEAVKEGKFSLTTTGGDIILPSYWSQVINPGAIVQVVLPADILDPDIAAHYRYEGDSAHRSRYQRYSEPVSLSRSCALDPESRSAAVGSRTDGSTSSGSEDYDNASSRSDDDFDLSSISSESETSENSTANEPSRPIRQVNTPTDVDGNNLVFKVDTTHIGSRDWGTANASDASKKRDPQQPVGNAESFSIAKVISSQSEDRNWLQIVLLKGPRTSSAAMEESTRWFHLRSLSLDLNGFKETCLSIPGLSSRLQVLVGKTFDKVEKEKLKVSLDGMFIEPGTVLRADESQRADPESVVFSCVPYFDLQIPAKKKLATGQVSRFPSRTLMQSYYPYEPVQDRDAEQAYRKFGNEQRDALIHVPNLWMVNIGSDIVATCGHQALDDVFVQSIQVVQMDRDFLKEGDETRSIRLLDWDGRKLLYTVDECRSYFQMEQRMKELRSCSSRSSDERILQLSWESNRRQVRVTPRRWPSILQQKDSLFIDLSLLDDVEHDEKDTVPVSSPITLIPEPFFQWPQQKTGSHDGVMETLLSDGLKRSIRCLELVEKAMVSEVLRSDESYSAVEETFTSTEYYRTFTQSTAEDAKSSLIALQTSKGKLERTKEGSLTSHRAVIFRQHIMVAQRTSDLYDCMHKTLDLFVRDVDKNTMLRKSWAAMEKICDIATSVLKREPQDSESDKQADNERADPPASPRKWFVRPEISVEAIAEPLQNLEHSFKKCRRCTSFMAYSTSQAALLHVQKHFKHAKLLDSTILSPADCVINRPQMSLEVMNRGCVDILTKACQEAQQLLAQATELSEGVLNENGQMSNLYTLPRSLLGAFRQLLVFYFAVERAMFYAEDAFQKATSSIKTKRSEYRKTPPFSSSVKAIGIFAGGVQQALLSARAELCSMVKSAGPVEVFKRLCLSPEYTCGWLMRRMIVKPLEKSMTVSDMYREYLSTIQFQVNHRPSKRLLRTINLLQEEIAAIQEINTQQSKLISNYMSVLDDTTYEKDIPYRRAMFSYERMLLESCLDNLKMTDQECRYLLARCGPLSDSTKQSLEINEEDHGKAILVFTVVTVIFLPLSFVTSYLGMNTTDIRDMGSSSTLFWAIAVPLTAVTMGSVMYIGYNGDDLRDAFSSVYRSVTGKQDRSVGARGISVAQRKLARKSADSGSALDFSSLADEAEFANPRPEDYYRTTYRNTYALQTSRRQYSLDPPAPQWEPYTTVIPEPRTGLRTQPLRMNDDTEDDWYASRPGVNEVPRRRRPTRRTSEYSLPEADYIPPRPSATFYDRTRTESRPEARTYNEAISLDVPPSPIPIPFSYVRRTRRDDSRYIRRSTTRVAEQHDAAPPQYEWTKKSHRHYRTTRDRRRSNGTDGSSVL